ncbi:MAG TPA: glycoside hydrolase family 97 N-terminal domain-containing protein, partial [Terracidiphilus sp.]|nr:glycoside hydrolase family 97 N-terminal domain-containing protein [Terracidiphilus sp.]
MPCLRQLFLCAIFVVATSLTYAQNSQTASVRVVSPNDQVILILSTGPAQGEPMPGPPVDSLRYAVEFHGKTLFGDSLMGLKLEGQEPLGPGMRQRNAQKGSADETYTIPVGKTSSVRDHYNSARVDFEDAKGRKLSVEARAYDDGVAFRYVLPEQAAIKSANVEHELTEFQYSKDATAYPLILDGFRSSYEDEYQARNVSGIHRDWLVALPLLADVPGVGWVAVTEADIDNYAGMYLRKDKPSFALRAQLAPHLDPHSPAQSSIAVEADAPVTTPWRVLMIGDAPGRLVESNIVLNLNPPSKIADTSWIVAGKSAWDWWSGEAAPSVSFTPGMNTDTMKHYI